MKTSASVILMITLTVLAGCQTVPSTSGNEEGEIANQHIAISVLMANYYCENNKWPSSIEQIEKFQNKEQLPLPVQVNWPFLERPAVRYEVGNQVVLITPAENKTSGYSQIRSVNSYPGCDNNNMKVNVDIHVDAQKENN